MEKTRHGGNNSEKVLLTNRPVLEINGDLAFSFFVTKISPRVASLAMSL